MHKLGTTTLFMALICCSALAGSKIVVIVNNDNPTSKIEAVDLKKIYTGKTTKWENDETILVIDKKANSPDRKLFSKAVLGKTPKQMKIYWIKKSLKEGCTGPTVLKEDELIIKKVAENKGAIGYVAATSPDSTVKSVKVKGITFE